VLLLYSLARFCCFELIIKGAEIELLTMHGDVRDPLVLNLTPTNMLVARGCFYRHLWRLRKRFKCSDCVDCVLLVEKRPEVLRLARHCQLTEPLVACTIERERS
jgi:hypothetical protein